MKLIKIPKNFINWDKEEKSEFGSAGHDDINNVWNILEWNDEGTKFLNRIKKEKEQYTLIFELLPTIKRLFIGPWFLLSLPNNVNLVFDIKKPTLVKFSNHSGSRHITTEIKCLKIKTDGILYADIYDLDFLENLEISGKHIKANVHHCVNLKTLIFRPEEDYCNLGEKHIKKKSCLCLSDLYKITRLDLTNWKLIWSSDLTSLWPLDCNFGFDNINKNCEITFSNDARIIIPDSKNLTYKWFESVCWWNDLKWMDEQWNTLISLVKIIYGDLNNKNCFKFKEVCDWSEINFNSYEKKLIKENNIKDKIKIKIMDFELKLLETLHKINTIDEEEQYKQLKKQIKENSNKDYIEELKQN